MKTEVSLLRLIFAWAVHLFTASGSFLGFLASLSYIQEQYRVGTLYLFVAVLVDSVDGFFARLAQVKHVVPSLDGALLDNIIDFSNYTFVPLLLLWRSQLVGGQATTYFVVVAILLASLYQFCQLNAKTDNHFFLGFPSYWNIVIVYLYWLKASVTLNICVLLFLVFVSFVPIRFLYPSRSYYFRFSGILICLLEFFLFAYIILFSWSNPPILLLWLIFLLFLAYCFLSLIAYKRSIST